MALEGELHIILPLVIGFLIGLIEAYFVYEDEGNQSGQQFIGDMWHGLLFAVLGTIIATNTLWIFANFNIPTFIESMLFMDEAGRSLVVSTLITLIMMIKMVSAKAIKGVSNIQGFKEKFWHKAVIAIAVGFSPYYIFLMYDFVQPFAEFFPSWMPL